MKIQRKLKKQGRFFSIAGITLALGAIGLIGGAVGTAVQIEAGAEASKASKKAEELRKRQMQLEAQRSRRKEIRQSLLERAGIINAAAVQGALGSSGQVGGAGSAVSTAGQNVQEINQSEAIGNELFDTNKRIASARSRAALGSSAANFGFTTAANADKAGRIGAQLFKL